MLKKLLSVSALGLAITLPAAFADSGTSLGVGATLVSPNAGSLPVGAVADTGLVSFTGTAGTATKFTGEFESEVVKDSTTGDLDFYYYVANDSTSEDAIERITAGDFTGYTTSVSSVGYGGSVPVVADRNTPDAVGFTVDLTPGENSGWLEVETNATTYNVGNVVIQDDGQAYVSAFAPAPEPMSMSLLGGGLLGLGLLRWRRSAKK